MSSKRVKGSVGGGEEGKKVKTTPDTGEKSVSEKSQTTRTSRNPFEKSKSMTKNGPEFLIGWRDFPLERDDTWEPISNLTGSEHMICEFQKQHELDYADRRKAMDETTMHVTMLKKRTTRRRMLKKRTTRRRSNLTHCSEYTTLLRMHSKEGGILTAMCQVGGHVECKKTITMPNGDTQGVLQHFGRCHPDLNLKIRTLNLAPSAAKNPPNFMTLLNQDVPSCM